MEKKLLRSDSGQKATRDESSGTRRRIVWQEGWKTPAGNHHPRPFSFQFNLPQAARDLQEIDGRTFGTSLDHQAQVVVRELAH